MKVPVIPIVIGSFGTITKGLVHRVEELEIGGLVATIQTTALLRSASILRSVLETWGELLSLKLHCETIRNPVYNMQLKKEKKPNQITHVHTHIYLDICVYVRMYEGFFVCTCAYMWVSYGMCVCVCVFLFRSHNNSFFQLSTYPTFLS